MLYDGTDSSDTMVPDVVLWWYRFPILSHNDKNYYIKKASWNPYLFMKFPTGFTIPIPH